MNQALTMELKSLKDLCVCISAIMEYSENNSSTDFSSGKCENTVSDTRSTPKVIPCNFSFAS